LPFLDICRDAFRDAHRHARRGAFRVLPTISPTVLPMVLVALALGGCSGSAPSLGFGKSAPPPPPTDPNVFPTKYRTEVTGFMRTWLNNPSKVKDAFISEPVLRPVAGTPHYIACVRYNPRNSDNRYEGPQQRVAIFLGGQLNQFVADDPQMCAGLSYQRYPELEAIAP
jgi:hypothetical protein